MYSLEHEAHPRCLPTPSLESGGRVSPCSPLATRHPTPITTMGKLFGIFIAFWGVEWWPSPRALSPPALWTSTPVSSGSAICQRGGHPLYKVNRPKKTNGSGQTIQNLGLPAGIIVAAIQRGGQIVVPRGNVELLPDDTLSWAPNPWGRTGTSTEGDGSGVPKSLERPAHPGPGHLPPDH